MAAFDLEEQEQISQIKGWWEQYGKLVTGVAVAAALASFSIAACLFVREAVAPADAVPSGGAPGDN